MSTGSPYICFIKTSFLSRESLGLAYFVYRLPGIACTEYGVTSQLLTAPTSYVASQSHEGATVEKITLLAFSLDILYSDLTAA